MAFPPHVLQEWCDGSARIKLGQCSLCGGDVTVPQVYMSTNPPVPTCDRCGAVKRGDGPVIDMVKR